MILAHYDHPDPWSPVVALVVAPGISTGLQRIYRRCRETHGTVLVVPVPSGAAESFGRSRRLG